MTTVSKALHREPLRTTKSGPLPAFTNNRQEKLKLRKIVETILSQKSLRASIFLHLNFIDIKRKAEP